MPADFAHVELQSVADDASAAMRLAVGAQSAHSPEAEYLRGVLEQIASFARTWNSDIASTLALTGAPESDFPSDSESDDLKELIEQVRGAARYATALLNDDTRSFDHQGARSEAEKLSSDFEGYLRSLSRRMIKSGIAQNAQSRSRLVEDTVRQLSFLSTQNALDSARDVAERAVADTKQAAGEVGSGQLSQHFGQAATSELQAANRFRTATIATLAAIILIAGYWLFWIEVPLEAPVPRELIKLAITLPLAALAFYLSRESSRHRERANWANDLAIQLKTLEAYLAPLSDDHRSTLRASFGYRVFSQRAATDPGDASIDLAALGDFAGKILNIGRSDPPK